MENLRIRHVLEAERSILGAMLRDASTLKFCDMLSPEAFESPANREIYSVIASMRSRGKQVDFVTLDEELTKRGTLNGVGGAEYLIALTQYVPVTANCGSYVDIVLERYARRRIMGVADTLKAQAIQEDSDVLTVIHDAKQMLSDIEYCNDDIVSLSDTMAATYALLDERMKGANSPVNTGITPLDGVFYGFVPGELTIIGARPGGGKSMFAASVAVSAARRGKHVLIVSLEMADVQYGQRLLAHGSGVNSEKIRNASVDGDDLIAIVRAMQGLSQLPIWFMYNARTIEPIRAMVQQRIADKKLDMLIIDYLQLMRDKNPKANDYERVSALSLAMKEISVTHNIPVVALAQLSRAAADRKDKQPILSDLRSSGSIEQDADNVIFLHKPESSDDSGVYDDDKAMFQQYENMGLHYTTIIIAKQRQGQTGRSVALLDPRIMRYTAIERGYR